MYMGKKEGEDYHDVITSSLFRSSPYFNLSVIIGQWLQKDLETVNRKTHGLFSSTWVKILCRVTEKPKEMFHRIQFGAW
jgi:hypothetical protein